MTQKGHGIIRMTYFMTPMVKVIFVVGLTYFMAPNFHGIIRSRRDLF